MHPPVRLVAIDMDGTLLPTFAQKLSPRVLAAIHAAHDAGIIIAVATGRRYAYTVPILHDLGLPADMPLITSNGAVLRTLSGDLIHSDYMQASVARQLCGLLRPFGAVVFTFDRPGRGELVLEDLEQTHGRISLWVEANRNAIEVIKPLERAFDHDEHPIQGMVTGHIPQMRAAEAALKASPLADLCGCACTVYPGRDLSILDLLPKGVTKATALARLATRYGVDRKETMAIGDNWNDVDMLEWAAQAVVMGNASEGLRTLAKTSGWKQAPPNDQDGVAVILERAIQTNARATARV
jgi:hypothetical protein